MTRLEELQEIFKGIDEDKRIVIAPLIAQAVEWEKDFDEYTKQLAEMELTRHTKEKYLTIHKLKREAQQQLCNIYKTLLMTLYRVETNAADELLQKLSEFE